MVYNMLWLWFASCADLVSKHASCVCLMVHIGFPAVYGFTWHDFAGFSSDCARCLHEARFMCLILPRFFVASMCCDFVCYNCRFGLIVWQTDLGWWCIIVYCFGLCGFKQHDIKSDFKAVMYTWKTKGSMVNFEDKIIIIIGGLGF